MIDPENPFLGVEAAERSAAAATATRLGRTPEMLNAVVAEAGAHADGLMRALPEALKPGLACGSGCAACCYQLVATVEPEVFALARHLTATLAEAELATLRVRIADTAAQVRGLSTRQRFGKGLPCPLLDRRSRQCRAYDVRPLACKSYTSLRRVACDKAQRRRDPDQPIPAWKQAYEIHTGMASGLRQGLADAGLPASTLELIAALDRALNTPDAEARWLGGERVFADAAVV